MLSEEFQRLNIDFDQARQRILGEEREERPVVEPKPDNQQSMAQLQLMLAGTNRPVKIT